MNIATLNRRRAVLSSSGGGVVNVSLNGVDWQSPVTQNEGWQEYCEKDTSSPSGFLDYSDGTTSSYKIEVVGSPLTGRNDGEQTGDDSGIVPDAALINCLGATTEPLTTWTDCVKFTGLDNNMTYSIETISSVSFSWGWVTHTRIDGGTEQSYTVSDNTSNSALFENLSPTSGELTIEFKSSVGWAIINAVILREE